MPGKKANIEEAKQRARAAQSEYLSKPKPEEVLAPDEIEDAAPFYFVLRNYVRQLREARERSGQTLKSVSEKSGIAEASLSRLETGAQTNPTWKTLGLYAVAVGVIPVLLARQDTSAESQKGPDDSAAMDSVYCAPVEKFKYEPLATAGAA